MTVNEKTKIKKLQRNNKGQFIKGITPWNKGLPTWICNYCGKEFQAVANSRAKRRYCSNECKGKESISLFNKGHEPWNFHKPNNKIRGDKHYNWKGGKLGARHLNRVEWVTLRDKCYARDNWTCFKCGKKVRAKGEIQAHHLIPKRLNGLDVIDNLITLCRSCHIKIEKKIWQRLTVSKQIGGGAL